MASLRDWLVFSRIHTAAMTGAGVALAAYLANPGISPMALAWWVLVAVACHGSGMMINNLFDGDVDAAQPEKAHFPLVSGAISRPAGWAVALVASYAAMGAGVALTRGHLLGVVCLTGYAVFGTLYNALSKRVEWSWVFISVSFSSLLLWSWFGNGGGWTWMGLYLGAYSFSIMVAQISYSGCVKDLHSDPVNWLRGLGAVAVPVGDTRGGGTYRYIFPLGVVLWGWSTRMLCVLLAGAWVSLWGRDLWLSWWPWPAFVIMSVMVAVFGMLSRGGVHSHRGKVRLMGIVEVLAYFLLVASLVPWLGSTLVWWFVLPLVWFVGWNWVMWGHGHLLGPRV